MEIIILTILAIYIIYNEFHKYFLSKYIDLVFDATQETQKDVITLTKLLLKEIKK